MYRTQIVSILCAGLALSACAGAGTDDAGELGPLTYDEGGTMPCSAHAPTYDGACGWRVVRKDGGAAEIWISNISIPEPATYRVLDFANGEFVARDGTSIDVNKSGDTWSVSVPGREYYRFPGSVITG